MEQAAMTDPEPAAQLRLRTAAIVWSGTGLAIAFAAAEISSGPGYRFGWWDYRTGFSILEFAAWGALGAAAVLLAGCILARLARSRTLLIAGGVGLAIGAAGAAVPGYFYYATRNLPAIHDIATDTEDPPPFYEMKEVRFRAENSVNYPSETAAEQKRSYPDIAPAMLAVPPAQAFGRALEIAREMDWSIVTQIPYEGRIEATATTLLFGFREDIAIRVRPEGGGSRVDVRSSSRVGQGDFGTNAARVREFLARINAHP